MGRPNKTTSQKLNLTLFVGLLGMLLVWLPIKAHSQAKITRVYPYSTGEKGVTYFLPKSVVKITFTLEKTSFHRGVFAPYAEVLLGELAPLSDAVSYKVQQVAIESVGIPDTEQRYAVEFRPQTPASFVTLTREGLLAGINTEWNPEPPPTKKQLKKRSALPRPALPVEYAQATSQAMRAKIAAETLFSFREDLMLLLTGKAENAPKDGEAYQETLRFLRDQVSSLEALFYGDSLQEELSREYLLEPSLDESHKTVAYFSPTKGIVDGLASEEEAIAYHYKVLSVAQPLSPEEEKKRDRRLDGIVYNVPGLAEVSIVLPDGVTYKRELPITQLGNRVLLNKEINRNKSDAVMISFNPATGQLRAIQESR